MEYDERYRNLNIPLEGSLKLFVTAHGLPHPTLTWHKDGMQISDSRNVSIDTEDGRTVLTIKHVTRQDDGEYSLTAKNEHGSNSVTFAIHVTGKNMFTTHLSSTCK